MNNCQKNTLPQTKTPPAMAIRTIVLDFLYSILFIFLFFYHNLFFFYLTCNSFVFFKALLPAIYFIHALRTINHVFIVGLWTHAYLSLFFQAQHISIYIYSCYIHLANKYSITSKYRACLSLYTTEVTCAVSNARSISIAIVVLVFYSCLNASTAEGGWWNIQIGMSIKFFYSITLSVTEVRRTCVWLCMYAGSNRIRLW
jgi:hypothetical protein